METIILVTNDAIIKAVISSNPKNCIKCGLWIRLASFEDLVGNNWQEDAVVNLAVVNFSLYEQELTENL